MSVHPAPPRAAGGTADVCGSSCGCPRGAGGELCAAPSADGTEGSLRRYDGSGYTDKSLWVASGRRGFVRWLRSGIIRIAISMERSVQKNRQKRFGRSGPRPLAAAIFLGVVTLINVLSRTLARPDHLGLRQGHPALSLVLAAPVLIARFTTLVRLEEQAIARPPRSHRSWREDWSYWRTRA